MNFEKLRNKAVDHKTKQNYFKEHTQFSVTLMIMSNFSKASRY